MDKPTLIVFDLDYTLWPFWVDTHVDPPFRKDGNSGKVYDAHGRQVEFYPDVPSILQQLHAAKYTLAVASRTSCTHEARDLVCLFDWDKYFTYKEIYPGSKVAHFKKFHEYTKNPYSRMLFFDDEHRNIVQVGGLGVTAIHAPDGMTSAILEQGLRQFAKSKES